jgi:hypothetical protein
VGWQYTSATVTRQGHPMLVSKITGDCPGCGAPRTFGNVSVLGDELLRGCQRCSYKIHLPLPPVSKKVIYLDQFFFSSAFRGKDARFIEAAERIRRATHLQLLVSPYSSVHEDETHQWRGQAGKAHDDLMDFIKASSRGMKFEPAYTIERTQIVRAFRTYLAGTPPDYLIKQKDAIRGDLDKWDSYFRVDVGQYLPDVELKRRLKAESVNRLITLLDVWQGSPETFEEHVALELRDSGQLYRRAFYKMMERVAQGDLAAFMDSPVAATIVEQMLDVLPDTVEGPARMARCVDFFNSAHFAAVPSEWLSAHLFATIREMVRQGAYANRAKAKERLRGILGDIDHISTYAPYCDAFLMDVPMAEIVSKPTVSLEARYGVKVFSLRNLDELFTWLDDLEARMSSEHRTAHCQVYP